MAALLVETGTPVLIDATAHRRIWRDLVREAVPHFAEVQLVCPLAICRERERERAPGHAPRNIYQQAGRPGATVPGVDVAYEAALAPELLIDTSVQTVGGIRGSGRAAGRSARPAPAAAPPLRRSGPARTGLGDLDHGAAGERQEHARRAGGGGAPRARSPRAPAGPGPRAALPARRPAGRRGRAGPRPPRARLHRQAADRCRGVGHRGRDGRRGAPGARRPAP